MQEILLIASQSTDGNTQARLNDFAHSIIGHSTRLSDVTFDTSELPDGYDRNRYYPEGGLPYAAPLPGTPGFVAPQEGGRPFNPQTGLPGPGAPYASAVTNEDLNRNIGLDRTNPAYNSQRGDVPGSPSTDPNAHIG
jgi:hypothetical protein